MIIISQRLYIFGLYKSSLFEILHSIFYQTLFFILMAFYVVICDIKVTMIGIYHKIFLLMAMASYFFFFFFFY